MKKFQISFSKVPKAIRSGVVKLVAEQLDKQGYLVSGDLIRIGGEHTDVHLVFGDARNAAEWNQGAYAPSYFTVYHAIEDFDKWSKIKYTPFTPVEVVVNKEYTAVINRDHVQVGCQRVEFEVIEKLAREVKKVRESQA